MKTIITILLFIYGTSLFGQVNGFGKARIAKINYYYEHPDSFFPFDFTESNQYNQNPLKITQLNSNHIVIKNSFGNLLPTMELEIHIDSNLNILDVKYQSYSGVFDDTRTRSDSVDQITLYFNQNPFIDTLGLIGRYTVIIDSEESFYTRELKPRKIEQQYYHPFMGKFKVYSMNEKKLSKEQLREKMETDNGDLDTNGIYHIPEYDPQYCYDQDSLNKYLTKILKSELNENELKNIIVDFELIIDRTGNIEQILIQTKTELPKKESDAIKKEIMTNSCWIPAIHYGRTVKSTLYLSVEIKE